MKLTILALPKALWYTIKELKEPAIVSSILVLILGFSIPQIFQIELFLEFPTWLIQIVKGLLLAFLFVVIILALALYNNKQINKINVFEKPQLCKKEVKDYLFAGLVVFSIFWGFIILRVLNHFGVIQMGINNLEYYLTLTAILAIFWISVVNINLSIEISLVTMARLRNFSRGNADDNDHMLN